MHDSLHPLPPQAITAARLRKLARELILEAEALEASIPARPVRRDVKLVDPRKRMRRHP